MKHSPPRNTRHVRVIVLGMERQVLLRAGQGAALALTVVGVGLPFALDPRNVEELFSYAAYVGLTTMLAFAWFGANLGRREAELESALCRADRASLIDPVTGLWNARYFRRRLHDSCLEAERFGRPLSLVIFDLDDFKKVNDRFGHAIGDFALRLAASALGATTREGDVAARVGGEELALILPETDGRAARAVAERVLREIRRKARDLPAGCKLSASAGLATVSSSPGSKRRTLRARALFREADTALYDAKRSGKDRVAGGFDSDPEPAELSEPASRSSGAKPRVVAPADLG
ncbi:MAG: GGDEF domain-containing protein [Deltaproteobacteria bacterium]|nr:GGDEF domain-containing protein [Deltaproteobacteria bacterium]